MRVKPTDQSPDVRDRVAGHAACIHRGEQQFAPIGVSGRIAHGDHLLAIGLAEHVLGGAGALHHVRARRKHEAQREQEGEQAYEIAFGPIVPARAKTTEHAMTTAGRSGDIGIDLRD